MDLVSRAAHRATTVNTISQHARQDIMDVLHIPPERIRVIYQAVGEEYQPVTNQEQIKAARERYGLGERYIFYIGGLDQRENVPQLVRAFTHLQAQIGHPHRCTRPLAERCQTITLAENSASNTSSI